jgi:hypothetical protein
MIIQAILEQFCQENDLDLIKMWSVGAKEYYDITPEHSIDCICEVAIFEEIPINRPQVSGDRIYIYPRGISNNNTVNISAILLADPNCFTKVQQTVLKLYKEFK